jgi:hypothetical protein
MNNLVTVLVHQVREITRERNGIYLAYDSTIEGNGLFVYGNGNVVIGNGNYVEGNHNAVLNKGTAANRVLGKDNTIVRYSNRPAATQAIESVEAHRAKLINAGYRGMSLDYFGNFARIQKNGIDSNHPKLQPTLAGQKVIRVKIYNFPWRSGTVECRVPCDESIEKEIARDSVCPPDNVRIPDHLQT